MPISIERLPGGKGETSSNVRALTFILRTSNSSNLSFPAARSEVLPTPQLSFWLRNFKLFYKLNSGRSSAVLFRNWLYSADMHISITIWTDCCITACVLRRLWCDRLMALFCAVLCCFVLFCWSSKQLARYCRWLVKRFAPLEAFRRQLMFSFLHHINWHRQMQSRIIKSLY